MRTWLSILLILFCNASLLAQATLDFQQRNQVHIRRTREKIKVDGKSDEATWKSAEPVSDFWEKWPNDKDPAKRKTEVRMAYDDLNIYLMVVAYDTNRYVIQTLKRDNGIYDSDAFSVALDPVNQRTNGFLFSVNPYNVQTEDLVSGASGDLNFSWDNKWYSATERHETFWTAEIAIPFKTLRYEAGKTTWGINFLRSDLKNNQYSSWTHMPVNFPFFDFGYSGALVWDQSPPPPGTNISFIPYITANANTNAEENSPLKGSFNAGFDGKVAVTPSLNLDITVNPDFSQIEVDRQVTNLTRFNIFFPERRTFFLENDDLFSAYGIPPIRPFYSRRIGLDNEGSTIPILGGLRLSGNLAKKTRIGIMNMQTLAKDGFQAQNYTAATFNQRVQSRSLVKGYFLNRQAIGTNQNDIKDPLDAFGRNAGLEYNYSDQAGKWQGWAGYHHSFKPGIHSDNRYLNLGGMFASKSFEAVFDYSDIGDLFYADMGFVNRIENYDAKLDTVFRQGFRHIFNSYEFRLFPKSIRINQHRLGLENYTVWNRDGSLNETNHSIGYEMLMRNTSALSGNLSYTLNNLPYYTRFTDDIYEPLPPGRYQYWQGNIEFSSDSRKKFIVEGGLTYGGFYNGKIFQSSLSLTWRAQPWGNFTLNFQNAKLEFPDPYGKTDLILVAPRIEINFSNSIFWTTFIQFNSQNNNFNVNSRLQWRYKPMSDIFLVYTDNYYTDPLLKNKNRALVFKMNYWLNL